MRGSSTGLSVVVPIKVKACKSFLFTEGSLKVENNSPDGPALLRVC